MRYRGKSIADVLDMTVEDALNLKWHASASSGSSNTPRCGADHHFLGQRSRFPAAAKRSASTELSCKDTGNITSIFSMSSTTVCIRY
ncbi:MAG: hypothetical protein R3B47_01455 [Bacteroidia bacterium]